MKKVTKRSLVACVAALAVGACQDSVTVVEPAPPPPPPTTPPVDATVTIQGLRLLGAGGAANPTNIFTDINVVLNVEEGDNTVTQISLLFDGTAFSCQSISGNVAPGSDQLRLSTAGAADDIECFWDTNAFSGACVGDQLDAQFPNGTHTLGARITLSDGTTRDAANAQQVTLNNQSTLNIVALPGTKSFVNDGSLYVGGEDLQFAVCPVSYNGTVVGALSLEADDNGDASATCGGAGCGDGDLGGGAGVAVEDDTPPFVWTMAVADNDAVVSGTGDAGTGVEDTAIDNGGVGHEVFTTGAVFDADGVNVTTEFAGDIIAGMYIDMVAPRVNSGGASEITISEPAAGSSTMNVHYSAANFGLSFVDEDGSGWSFGAGAQLDIGDCSDTDNSDAADATDFVPTVSDVKAISDLTEDDWELGGDGFGGTDGGGDDCYMGELRSLADNLDNSTPLDDPGSIPAQIQTAAAFGVDMTGALLDAPVPDATVTVLNPDANADGMTCADVGDCVLMFDGADVELASGDPGSSIDETGCLLGGPCTNITGEIVDGPGTTHDGDALNIDNGNTNSTDKGGTDDDFLIDIGFGANPTFPLTDGAYEIEATVPDFALDPNESVMTFLFTLDDTPPTFGALNPAPVGSAGTDASAIVMSIGGTINDANIIDTAELEVYVDGSDNIGTGANGVCDAATDFKLSVTGGDIDRNDVDLTNATNAITFNESFTINQPDAAARTLRYCFIIGAEDESVLADGTDQGNVSSLTTAVDVTWNAG